MLEATALPLRERGPRRPRGSVPRMARTSLPTAWVSGGVHPVDIVVHDRESARILLEYAVPLFDAEVVAGSAWAVRLQPPSATVGPKVFLTEDSSTVGYAIDRVASISFGPATAARARETAALSLVTGRLVASNQFAL